MAEHVTPPPPHIQQGPTLYCVDCDRPYHWSESPSLERCWQCDEQHAWYHGLSEDQS